MPLNPIDPARDHFIRGVILDNSLSREKRIDITPTRPEHEILAKGGKDYRVVIKDELSLMERVFSGVSKFFAKVLGINLGGIYVPVVVEDEGKVGSGTQRDLSKADVGQDGKVVDFIKYSSKVEPVPNKFDYSIDNQNEQGALKHRKLVYVNVNSLIKNTATSNSTIALNALVSARDAEEVADTINLFIQRHFPEQKQGREALIKEVYEGAPAPLATKLRGSTGFSQSTLELDSPRAASPVSPITTRPASPARELRAITHSDFYKGSRRDRIEAFIKLAPQAEFKQLVIQPLNEDYVGDEFAPASYSNYLKSVVNFIEAVEKFEQTIQARAKAIPKEAFLKMNNGEGVRKAMTQIVAADQKGVASFSQILAAAIAKKEELEAGFNLDAAEGRETSEQEEYRTMVNDILDIVIATCEYCIKP